MMKKNGIRRKVYVISERIRRKRIKGEKNTRKKKEKRE